MFGYFKINETAMSSNTDGHNGMKAFIQCIEAFATAAAGTTPTNPDTNSVEAFEVISNSEAGGWTKKYPDFGASPPSPTNQSYEFEAPTKKTGTTDWGLSKKVFGFNVNNYSLMNNSSYWGIVQPYMRFVREDADGNRVGDELQWLSERPGGFSSTMYGAWPSDRTVDLYDFGYYISVTENYLIIKRGSANDTSLETPVVGVVDITAGHPNDYSPKSPHMPFVGFYYMQTGTTQFLYDNCHFTIEYQVDTSARAVDSGHAGEYVTGDGRWNTNETDANQITITSDPVIGTFGQPTNTDNSESLVSYQVKHATYDDQMRLVPGLYDIYMFNPWYGSPMRILHGIKEVGLVNSGETNVGERDDYEQEYKGAIITDQDGLNWFIFEGINDNELFYAIRAD